MGSITAGGRGIMSGLGEDGATLPSHWYSAEGVRQCDGISFHYYRSQRRVNLGVRSAP